MSETKPILERINGIVRTILYLKKTKIHLMKILLENIKELVQVAKEPLLFRAGADMKTVTTIKNAFFLFSTQLIF
jgi:hypothetical protein